MSAQRVTIKSVVDALYRQRYQVLVDGRRVTTVKSFDSAARRARQEQRKLEENA